jgi:hypothetical protein
MTNVEAIVLTNEVRHPRTFTFTIKIIGKQQQHS